MRCKENPKKIVVTTRISRRKNSDFCRHQRVKSVFVQNNGKSAYLKNMDCKEFNDFNVDQLLISLVFIIKQKRLSAMPYLFIITDNSFLYHSNIFLNGYSNKKFFCQLIKNFWGRTVLESNIEQEKI